MNSDAISVRRCTDRDWDFVIGVTGACMREYAERTWGQWRPETRDSFTPGTHSIIEYGGADVGCLEFVEEPDLLVLAKLYIEPEHQNKGIGGVLLERLIEKARSQNIPIKLSVLAVNPARRFYERYGFEVTSSNPERHSMEWRDCGHN